jgi:tetratricopeptide (TPR) repeat protein
MTYKGANKRLPQIAREQNVDVVVEGSVQRYGQRWEINVQLFDAADQPLWSGTYPGDLRDVLSLASNAARSIAEEIRVKMTPSEKQRLASARQVDPEAWLDYSYGRWYWNKRTTEGILGAIDHFQRAIAKDPKFAPAYSGLADAYALLGSAGVDAKRPLEVMPKAKQAALEAVKWDPLLAEGHTSLGYVRLSYDWDLDAARSEFERAIALNPGYATAYQWYAHYWLAMAQPEKALAAAREAQARDPYSLVINVSVGWCLYHGRRYGEAIEQYQAALKMGPEFALGHAVLAMAYEESRRFPEAIDEFGKALDRGSGSLALAGLGSAYGLAGRPADARKVLDQLQRIAVHEYVPAAYVAAIYAAMGDRDRGIEWTRKAFDERSDYMVYLRTEPWADSLRSDPRFRQIVESVASAKAP